MREIEFEDIIRQYKNPELVKRGGQRVVFKVSHPEFGNVALKVGNYCTQEDQEGWELERIEREINLLKKIDSPYYPKNFGFEKVSNNRYVILEEFVESTPLSECMNRFQTPFKIMALTKNLVTGLKIIWDMNIVHRDIKPENILIKPTGLPKIIDLGIARALDSNSITQTMFSGPCSKLYAAPELLRYNKKSIDWRTDQYNLGIILVQLLLKGTHPFDPSLVEGASIPRNIIDDNWYKKVFDDGNLLPMRSLASKLLGNQPYQRFRKYEFLMNEIDSCMGSLI